MSLSVLHLFSLLLKLIALSGFKSTFGLNRIMDLSSFKLDIDKLLDDYAKVVLISCSSSSCVMLILNVR
jgi:hypothetical protein